VDGPLTSGYGLRFRGLTPSIHHGVDVRVPEGTPILVMKAGRVTHAGPLGAYGLAVIVDHGGGLTTLYGHLSRVDVERGQNVDDRAALGLSGQTGNATGPHLHFEVRRHGRTMDPVPLLGGPPSRV
jgi:murein DD-endopeptidase MepM/ murein hydrolase activator NlpD